MSVAAAEESLDTAVENRVEIICRYFRGLHHLEGPAQAVDNVHIMQFVPRVRKGLDQLHRTAATGVTKSVSRE
jgi:hypothetical protein